jgi:hypothetical protein
MRHVLFLVVGIWIGIALAVLSDGDGGEDDLGCITDTECMEMWGGDGYDD